jgi:tRNA_anti-like
MQRCLLRRGSNDFRIVPLVLIPCFLIAGGIAIWQSNRGGKSELPDINVSQTRKEKSIHRLNATEFHHQILNNPKRVKQEFEGSEIVLVGVVSDGPVADDSKHTWLLHLSSRADPDSGLFCFFKRGQQLDSVRVGDKLIVRGTVQFLKSGDAATLEHSVVVPGDK